MNDKRAWYEAKHPAMNSAEINRYMVQAYHKLNIEKKVSMKFYSLFQAQNKIVKPQNAMAFFMKDKRAQYEAKYPDKSSTELTRHMAQAYTKLNHEKKVSIKSYGLLILAASQISDFFSRQLHFKR